MITVKNVKFLHSLSEETLCFTATVYENGKKIGDARNRGHGGNTDIYLDKNDRTMSQLSELEDTVDNLVYDIFNQKEREKSKKKFERDIAKSICFGETTLEYYAIGFKGNKQTFAEIILTHPEGLKHVQRLTDSVKGRLKGKERILNTNLAALGVNL